MNRLFVLQTPLSILTTWEQPPVTASKVRWDGKMYHHPDTLIFVGKTDNVKKRDHQALDYAVMNSLQEAHMAVRALEKQPKTSRKRKQGCKSVSVTQLSLFKD